jgi:hypothetical protein
MANKNAFHFKAVLDDFNINATKNWRGDNCTLAENTTTKIVGNKSLKITSLNPTFAISTTQSFGDLSGYTGVSSGRPAHGTIGLWVCVGNSNHLSEIILQIGSDSSNFLSIKGARTCTDKFELEKGWNYVVFRLKNGTTTGTPDWTEVDYARFIFSGSEGIDIYVNYITIKKIR